MTHYIITMKDGWKPGDCARCLSYCCVGPGGPTDTYCPIDRARPAVGVSPQHAIQYHPGIGWRHEGETIGLYAVKEKE